MSKLIFLGVDYKKGLGGVASVLKEYSKLFPEAVFISSTTAANPVIKLLVLIKAIIRVLFLGLKYPNSTVHIHGSSYNSFHRKFFIFKILRLLRVKVIYHIHGAEYHKFYEKSSPKIKSRIRYFVNNADCIICLSKQWQQFFITNFAPRRIEVLPNIVANPSIMEVIKSKETFNFLFLGYISKRKGIWLLLDVIEELKTELQGKFVFKIGGNGEVERLKLQILEKNLEGIVEFIGWVSKEEKDNHLNNADAYILPSYNEGLPISVLEAMSYNLPIISTNVGGIPEVLKDNVNGYLIEPGNKEQLLESIKKVIHQPKKFIALGENSEPILKPYMPQNVQAALNKIYSEI